LRASAKNHQRVTVLTDPLDYDQVLDEIENKGNVQPKTRLRLATKVYSLVSKYDSLIASYLNKFTKE
jgi:phosphoribosylaminoimidazolecarboxamide formyltransferase/IMP cyclohydrolase